jgi:hypothetical protein
MSINFCTLTSASVDTFCGNRRGIVLNQLLAKKYPPPVQHAKGGNPRVLRDTFAVPPPFEFEDRPTLTYEQPWITVEVEFGGKKGSQTVDNDAQRDFVSVTGLEVASHSDDEDEITVNIEDFEI